MSGFVLEDPPPRTSSVGGGPGRGRLAPWVVELLAFTAEHPGRWVRAREYDYQPNETRRRLKALGLETTTRRVDGVYRLYARTPGEEST